VLHWAWGTGDIFIGRLPADECYWKAKSGPEASGTNDERQKSRQDAGATRETAKKERRHPQNLKFNCGMELLTVDQPSVVIRKMQRRRVGHPAVENIPYGR